MNIGTIARKTVWTALAAGLAIVIAGCAERTTQKDVAKAQNKLEKEQQKTAEKQMEAQREVANADRKSQTYTASKPVTQDEANKAQTDVAKADEKAHEKVAAQKQEEREARADLKATEQKAQATDSRDAFVNDMEQKLADTENQIKQLKDQASKAQGPDKDALNLRADALEQQHKRANDALSDLKKADVDHWQAYREPVRTAMQELDSSLKTAR